MDYSDRLAISYYKEVAVINKSHKIFLVQHVQTGKFYVKKIFNVYNHDVYDFLFNNHISGIPKIQAMYEEQGTLTVIEEYISGNTLQEKIASTKLSAANIRSYISELCEILNSLHTAEPAIIHRDIKPTNIIITNCGHIFLIDFNAAKKYDPTSSIDTTLLGTEGYAAPEQYGFGASSPETDIYTIGIMMRQMADSMPEKCNSFNTIIEKCTQLNKKDRYSSVIQIQKALSSGGASSTLELPPGFRTKTPWKMIVSGIYYAFAIGISLNITSERSLTPRQLWGQRMGLLLIYISIIFISCNYSDVQRNFPLCSSQNPFIKAFGIILMNAASVILILMIMCIVTL
ncbi:MAG: protein kinase [Lachnospiraceae bacterium]|nr:protein kinase [Lachnospiraceae bacterium]